MNVLSPEYVSARLVLLDALGALAGHLDSLILVGAQAVYAHTGDADLAVPIMTTDADLAIDRTHLTGTPEIGAALRAADFVPGPNPGHWVSATDVAVDLTVVPHQSGTDRPSARAARVPPHERQTARIARGLEPALVDNEIVPITSLLEGDARAFDLRVAGPAALLSAKAIKIAERLAQAETQPSRVNEKDALDAFRLLQAVDISTFIAGFEKHMAESHAAAISTEAINVYRLEACHPEGALCQLASTAAAHDPAVALSFSALASELVAAYDSAFPDETDHIDVQ